jgi:hypothetical protein
MNSGEKFIALHFDWQLRSHSLPRSAPGRIPRREEHGRGESETKYTVHTQPGPDQPGWTAGAGGIPNPIRSPWMERRKHGAIESEGTCPSHVLHGSRITGASVNGSPPHLPKRKELSLFNLESDQW